MRHKCSHIIAAAQEPVSVHAHTHHFRLIAVKNESRWNIQNIDTNSSTPFSVSNRNWVRKYNNQRNRGRDIIWERVRNSLKCIS